LGCAGLLRLPGLQAALDCWWHTVKIYNSLGWQVQAVRKKLLSEAFLCTRSNQGWRGDFSVSVCLCFKGILSDKRTQGMLFIHSFMC